MRNPAKTRTCAGCGKKINKDSLLRIGKTKDGTVSLLTGGRGAYICKNTVCLEKAKKKKRIQSILKTSVSDEVFDKILNVIGCD